MIFNVYLILKKFKSAVLDKAMTVIVGLLFTLAGSGALHFWGIGQLDETKHKRDHQKERADSLQIIVNAYQKQNLKKKWKQKLKED